MSSVTPRKKKKKKIVPCIICGGENGEHAIGCPERDNTEKDKI